LWFALLAGSSGTAETGQTFWYWHLATYGWLQALAQAG
jgi:hypothetical protein